MLIIAWCCLVIGLGLDLVFRWLVVMHSYFTTFRCHCLGPVNCEYSDSISNELQITVLGNVL